MIVPVDTPLWMIAVATAFAVIFAKEVFGGTGYNIFNVALVTRAFLFFAYPAAMSGDKVFVRTDNTFGLGSGNVVDAFSGATPLGQVATATTPEAHMTDVLGNTISSMDMFLGFIPGSIGETSTLAILLGAAILIFTGIGSWKTMLISIYWWCRVLNPGYPEGMMLAILLLNAFAPLIDFYVIESNVKRRLKRAIK
jgi:Na+-transporting NADH:ubiquinone oxidoreductase subunit B